MKHTRPDAFLTRDVLCFVRDESPSPEAMIGRFGEDGFQLLRKSGAILVENGRLRLSPHHISPDGRRFVWGVRCVHLDEDRVDIVRRGPGGAL